MKVTCTSMFKYLFSLKLHLVGMVMVTLLPAMAIIFYSGMERREIDIRNAHERALMMARRVASEQEQITARTRQILGILANMPEVQTLNPVACNNLFRKIHKQNTDFAAILAAKTDGRVFASSLSFSQGLNIADRQYFQEAVKTRKFIAGEFSIGRLTGLRTVNYAQPVFNTAGRIIAIVIAGFNLDYYQRMITPKEVLEGYILGLTDRNGVRLYRYPNTDNEVTGIGAVVSPMTLSNILGLMEEGTYEGIGADGILRIYAYKQLRMEKSLKPYMAAFSGITKGKALQEAAYATDRNFIVLGLFALLTLIMAWHFGKATILDRMEKLIKATGRIRDGDLSARTGMSSAKGEFGQVAKAFDGMADSLEERTNALVQSEAKYKQLVENATDMIMGFDRNGNYIFSNPVTLRIMGYSDAELRGQTYLDHVRADYKKEIELFFKRQIKKRSPNIYVEYPIITKNGQEIWIGQNVQILLEGEHVKGLQTIARDISERRQMEEALQKAAITDTLTGLYNRRGFINLAQQQLKLAERSKRGFMLCFIDLDDLKLINDNGGHEEGDSALVEAATILKEAFRESDIIARVGGDEFAVLAIESDSDRGNTLKERLQKQIDLRNAKAGRRYHISMSVGAAFYHPHAPCTIDELMAIADEKMYAEKKSKKKC